MDVLSIKNTKERRRKLGLIDSDQSSFIYKQSLRHFDNCAKTTDTHYEKKQQTTTKKKNKNKKKKKKTI